MSEHEMQRAARVAFRRGWLLVAAACVPGTLLSADLIYRHSITTKTTETICTKIHRLDTTLEDIILGSVSQKELLKTSYYRAHPDEIAPAQAAALRTVTRLEAADCTPAELKATG